uniref:hypothetical protein n=1 Tax=Nocardioides sp. TaxID=35761 RepID=UPI00356582B2
VRLKFAVFMLSAAIAGLGGILLAGALGSVSGVNFLITSSLILVMLTVVGGVSYVSGALFGGILVGVGLSALAGTSGGLAKENADLAPMFEALGHLGALAIALTGIGVDKNPSGIVHTICSSYRPLKQARPVLYAGGAVLALLVAINLAGVIGDWSFALLTMLVVFSLPGVAAKMMPEAVLSRAERDEQQHAADTVPERMGLDARLTHEERVELDAALGLEKIHG